MKYIKTYVYFFLIILLAGSTAAPVLAQAKKKKDKKESVQSGDLVKARGYFHDAMKEVMLENYDAAEKLFRQCLALDPGNAAANYELGRIYYQREEIPEATALAEKAAELSPDNHWYLLFLGELYDQGGKNKEAIRVYQQLTRKWPRNADFYYLLAGAFMHDDNPSEAIKALDQVEAIQGSERRPEPSETEDLPADPQERQGRGRDTEAQQCISRRDQVYGNACRDVYAEREARQSLGDVHQDT